MQTVTVGLGLAAVALPDDSGQDRLEDSPDILRDPTDKIGQLQRYSSWVTADNRTFQLLAKRFCPLALSFGAELPALPLPLTVTQAVIVDLEATYRQAAADAYLT